MTWKARPVVKIFAISLFVLWIVAIVVGVAVYQTLAKSIPDPKHLRLDAPKQSSVIYDRTGMVKLYELSGEQRRKVVSHEQIPDVLRYATIAIEDDAFYRHNGFDAKSMMRAFIANVRSQSIKEGASTITQQLARNAFLTNDKTMKRKAQELLLAVEIEHELTKDEILDLYLNYIPYGSNVYGVQSAAEFFFGKDVSELDLDEAALLAALPKATTYYSPYGKHTDKLVQRQHYILQRMEELGYIDRHAFEVARKQNTLSKVIAPKTEIKAPHFVFYVIDQLESVLGEEVLEQGGLQVITTLDYELQQQAEKLVKESVEQNLSQYGAENSALVALDPKTGEVLAMVGSKDYFDQTIDGKVNVTLRPRQPGSSFKPIVYAKAFEKGYQPETLLNDAPINFGPDGSGEDYKPRNYDGRFRGVVPMRNALAMSLNIPAVQTLYLAGIDESIKLAKRLGITTLNQPDRYGLALVLGGGEVTLLDMATAYGVFASEGMKASTGGIAEVRDTGGKVLYSHSAGRSRILEVDVARKINSILSDTQARMPVFGRNNSLMIEGREVAVKTGTTQDFRDAWTIGYTPDLVVGVWAGNNDNRPMRSGADGSYVAAPIWNQFMQVALKDYPSRHFADYERVDSDRPMLTGRRDMTTQYFNKKTGEQLDEEGLRKTKKKRIEERQVPSGHSILYYVNKDDPLGPLPPDRRDPMLQRWERPFAYWGQD